MPTLKIIFHNNQFVDIQEKIIDIYNSESKHVFNNMEFANIDSIADMGMDEFIENYVSTLKVLLKNYVENNNLGEFLDDEKRINLDINGLNIIDIKTDIPNDVLNFFSNDIIFDKHFWGMLPHFDVKYNKIDEDTIKNLSQREVQRLIDNALDDKDFDNVKMLSKYLKENKHIMLFDNFKKYKI